MTAWSANVWRSFDLPFGEVPGLRAVQGDCADWNAFSHHGHGHHAARAHDPREFGEKVRISERIRDLFDGAAQDRSGSGALPPRRHRKGAVHRLKRFRAEPMVGHKVKQRPIEAIDEAELNVAQSRRALGNAVEHRLKIRRRA